MTRWRLTIEYDGGPFMGWQRQDHGPSVQQTLEEEKETDEKLTELAKQINSQANEEPGEAEQRQTAQRKSKRAA